MANLLNVPEYNDSLGRESRAFNSNLLQQLGKQIQTDIATVQINGQLKGLASGLQNANPESPEFGKQVVGLMSQYPLASQTPLGQAAINQLGAQHKFWQQEQLQKNDPWKISGGYKYNSATGEAQPLPTRPNAGRMEKITGPGGITLGFANPENRNSITSSEMGFEMPPMETPPKVGRYRTMTDGTVLDSATGNIQGTPRPRALPAAQAKQLMEAQEAVSTLANDIITNENEAKRLEGEYNGSSMNFMGNAGRRATAARQKATESYRALEAAKAKLDTLSKALRVGAAEGVAVAPAGANRSQIEAVTELPSDPSIEVAVPLIPQEVVVLDTPEAFTEAFKKASSGATLEYKGKRYKKP